MKEFFGGYICMILAIIRTIRHTSWPFGPLGAYMDGCDYVEQSDDSLKCERCGKVSL